MNKLKILLDSSSSGYKHSNGNPFSVDKVFCPKQKIKECLAYCILTCQHEHGTSKINNNWFLFCDYKKPLLEKLDKLEELMNE